MDVIGTGTYPDEYTRIDVFSLPIAKIAAGSDLTFNVPIGLLWNVVSLTAKFTASAAAANRIPTMFVKDQAGTIVFQYTLGTITAGQTGTFTLLQGVVTPATFATGTVMLEPFPQTWLPSGWSFGTSTAAIDSGDTWTNVAAWVQAYLPVAGE